MKKKSTMRKKTFWTHFTWLSVLVVSAVLFATCYEFTTIIQPDEVPVNSSFDVTLIIKGGAGDDFNYDLKNYGIFGVELPEGWTLDDSLTYNVKGTYVDKDPGVQFKLEGYVILRDSTAQMYEDTIGAREGYAWWGAVTDSIVYFDNLDSAIVTLTINVGDEMGDYGIRYAVGDYDDKVKRLPYDSNNEGSLTDPIPIKATWPANIEKYFSDEVSVYPNPAYDLLNVNVGGIRKGTIQLFDISGKMQIERNISSKETAFDVSDLASGVYLLKVKTDMGEHTQKVMIKK